MDTASHIFLRPHGGAQVSNSSELWKSPDEDNQASCDGLVHVPIANIYGGRPLRVTPPALFLLPPHTPDLPRGPIIRSEEVKELGAG